MPKKRNDKKIEKQMKETPMGRLAGESVVAHRSFLLWSMQSEGHRQMSVVARAVNRSGPTLNSMRKRWLWKERVEAKGSESLAQALYKRLYFNKFGMTEITMVQKNIHAPVTAFTSAPKTIMEGVTKSMKSGPTGDASTFTQEVKRKHLVLLDAAIGYIAQGIKSGDLRRSLRDLPVLIQLRNELNGEANSGGSGAALVVDSVRVSEAKLSGGDIVEAMYQDSIEVVAILEALRCRGKSGLHGKLSEEDVVNEQ